MKKIICDKLVRITKNRKNLEKKLNVKITNRGKEVSINGKPEEEYTAEKVIDALNFGFPFSVAMLISEQDFTFEILNIKDYTKRHDLDRVRARIIGKKGKTLSTLNQLTHCNFELKDNKVGIIGNAEHIANAQQAVISIIQGSKQTNVYSFLEKHQVKPVEDLGLKNTKE
ncbi:KH domain-containing protein [Nanoarchaeota archaeon]